MSLKNFQITFFDIAIDIVLKRITLIHEDNKFSLAQRK